MAEQAKLAGLPMPRVYEIESDSPNAFATGRSPKHATVAVTTGIRHMLDRRELRAALAHEMAPTLATGTPSLWPWWRPSPALYPCWL